MSGETEQNVSGWTTDTLKEYVEARLAAQAILSAERLAHVRELRALDAELRLAKEKYDDAHFAQLNENAKRTIEERGHFVSVEAFEPFKRQMLDSLALGLGSRAGSREVIGYLLGGVGALVAVVTIVVTHH